MNLYSYANQNSATANNIAKSAEDAKKRQQEQMENRVNLINSGGYVMDEDMLRRAGALNYGQSVGQKEFYEDPDMQRLRQLREQYAKGYSGEELGNIRQQARGEIAGNQQAQARKLASGLGKGGVGGARAAAIQAAGAREGGKAVAEAERKMALDSAQMQRQGAADLQDFIFRQKYGKVGLGAAFAGLSSADYAAQQARNANQPGKPGALDQLINVGSLGLLGEGPFKW